MIALVCLVSVADIGYAQPVAISVPPVGTSFVWATYKPTDTQYYFPSFDGAGAGAGNVLLTEAQGIVTLPNDANGWKVTSAKFGCRPFNAAPPTVGGVGAIPSATVADFTYFVCIKAPSTTKPLTETIITAQMPDPVPANKFGKFATNSDVQVFMEIIIQDKNGMNETKFAGGTLTVKAASLSRPK